MKILTSIREKDVFVVQSGSKSINDSIMELLILVNACRGGSANKVTGETTSSAASNRHLTFRSCDSIFPV